MKKLIMINMLFLMGIFCFGQNVDTMESVESVVEEIFMDDFISYKGKKYTIAMIDEASTFMVSVKHLEREIGTVEEFIEDYFDNISVGYQTVSSSWSIGTKLYKIKQIDENYYIAVEWADLTYGNKYYVYCHQKDANSERQLQKYYKELQK